jgi:hypothetical protein
VWSGPVLHNRRVLYKLNSWQIAAMPTLFVRGFPVITHSDVLLREGPMLVTAHDCFADSGRDSLANSITPSTVLQLKAGVHAPSMGDVITLQYYMVGISSCVMVFGTSYITVFLNRRAARGSPGICRFSFLSISHE